MSLRVTLRSAITIVALAVSLAVPAVANAQAREGIHVRGHWVIDVRNPDGTLVAHHEFDNALHNWGKNQLIMLLAGHRDSRSTRFVSGLWRVTLGDGLCDVGGDIFGTCAIDEPLNPPFADQTHRFFNLALTHATQVDQSYGNLSSGITLNGYARVGRDGSINRVRTVIGACDATENCGQQHGASAQPFTEHVFDSNQNGDPIPVTAGQVLQVKVTISFQ